MKLDDVTFRFTATDSAVEMIHLRAEISTIYDLLVGKLSEQEREEADKLKANHVAVYLLAAIDKEQFGEISSEQLKALKAEIVERQLGSSKPDSKSTE